MKFQNGPNGPLTNTETQHSTASVIVTHDKIVATGMESHEFDYIGFIFNGNLDGIGLQYDMLPGMFIFIFIFDCFNCFVV